MGFLDFFKNLFRKKEAPMTSPSETPQVKNPNTDGQFATPQSPASPQPMTPPEATPSGGQPKV